MKNKQRYSRKGSKLSSSKQAWAVFPEEFLERLEDIVPKSQFSQVLNAYCRKRPTTLRANTLKISASELQRLLTEKGVELESVGWWENAFVVKNQSLKYLNELELYKEGYFYVQSLSSMVPALLLDLKPGDRVLDITAAPGSKTTQMAALMQNQGEILANDNDQFRIQILQANLKIQGINIVKVIQSDGQWLWRQYPESFDKTLVDAPCSMEGRFYVGEGKSYHGWAMKKIKEYAHVQKFLLRSGISATKPGGTIVYSTCTLAPEENEGVVDWLLQKEGDAVKLEQIKIVRLDTIPGLRKWLDKDYLRDVSRTSRILPTTLMEGFFVAKFSKLKSTVDFNRPREE